MPATLGISPCGIIAGTSLALTTIFLGTPVARAADEPPPAEKSLPRWRDAQDGWLDLSRFLDTAYGFVPVISPITEPAVGYGAAAALLFINRKPAAGGTTPGRPEIAAIGGLATANGTHGWFGGHLGSWREDQLRTQFGFADADVNLTWYGLGGGAGTGSRGLDYTLSATGGMFGGSYGLRDRTVWVGLKYVLADTDVSRRQPEADRPVIPARDLDVRLAGLVPSLTFDTRDNFFTPTHGWYLDLSLPVYRDWLGSDRDFERATITAMHFRPLAAPLFLGVRSDLKWSSDGTPFYLRPFVSLRGVQAMRYPGEAAAEAELELRWQFHRRFSAVGFAGIGATHSEIAGRDRDDTVAAGGVGFRYLIARSYGLHMGLDVGWGPDDPILYVVFGNAWVRP